MGPRQGRRERRADGDGFEKRYEGAETLQGLLEIAGSTRTISEVEAVLLEGLQRGEPPSEVFPSLFDEEPRFPDPSYARRLYGNLFGAWERLKSGGGLQSRETAPERPRKPKPEAPGHFGDGPNEAWLARALQYLEQVEGRERDRLEHAFEQRADGALWLLDEEGFSDEAFFWARPLLFRMFALLELGRPEGAGSFGAVAPGPGEVPPLLESHVKTTLEAARRDERHRVSDAEAERLAGLMSKALRAFWMGRTKR